MTRAFRSRGLAGGEECSTRALGTGARMEDTPILASVERDLHISVDDLVHARDASSPEKTSATPTAGTTDARSASGE